jgi:hypothetical protein
MPPDVVIKTSTVDIVEVILLLLKRFDVAQTSWSNRTSRREMLSPSEVQ